VSDEPRDFGDLVARRPPLWQSFRAVAWSFFGVRRSAGLAHDVQRLNPVHLIIAGIVSAALFVGLLLLLVHWVAAGTAR
jgi:amino acid transporter